MALIIAAIIAIISLAVGFLGFLADGMSDAPGSNSGVAPYVIGGLIVVFRHRRFALDASHRLVKHG